MGTFAEPYVLTDEDFNEVYQPIIESINQMLHKYPNPEHLAQKWNIEPDPYQKEMMESAIFFRSRQILKQKKEKGDKEITQKALDDFRDAFRKSLMKLSNLSRT